MRRRERLAPRGARDGPGMLPEIEDEIAFPQRRHFAVKDDDIAVLSGRRIRDNLRDIVADAPDHLVWIAVCGYDRTAPRHQRRIHPPETIEFFALPKRKRKYCGNHLRTSEMKITTIAAGAMYFMSTP